MHIADLAKGMLGANGIVGGGPPLICGAALTAKTLKTGGVAVAFVGDGGSNQGTTFESYNLAKVWNLPAIFVVENNGYAETTAVELVGRRQPGRPRPRASACRATRSTASTSSPSTRRRARRSSGPAPAAARRLLHVKLTRYYGHFEGDARPIAAPDEVAKLRGDQGLPRTSSASA